jgi:hypothetical protein
MSDLLSMSKPYMAQRANDLLENILESYFITGMRLPKIQDIIVNYKEGTCTLDGREFVYANGGLSMIGPCPTCRMDVPSRRIRNFADIGDLLQNFRAGRHDCLDID